MFIRNNVVIPAFLVYNSDDYYTYLINSINTKYNYINEQILRDGSVVILLQGNVDKTYFMIPVDIFKLCFEYISTRATICEQPQNQEVYISMGHSCQYSHYKTLPANCIYLSLALSGFKTYTANVMTRRILNLFESQSKMLQNPCKNFRKLNDYLTVSYNEKMDPDKVSPDKNLNSTYLNIHYNDPSQELNKYLEIYHDVLGYYDPTSDPDAISNDYITFWKSGLYKMSSSNYGFDNIIWCVVGDYFNDVILHNADIYFMFFNSLRPTYLEVLESINAHKKSYYTEITSLDTTINYAPIDRIDDETIDDFYFVQYKTSDVIAPETYVRINNKTITTYSFEPLISGNDLIIIMKKWNIKQSELFEMYPGIHYNVNCRSNCTDISSDINETLKKTSVENKRKVFENIYSAEEDKRMIDAKQQTEKFKSGVNHNDLLSRAKFALNIAEKRGSTKFEKAENYGHKLKSKKSKSKSKSIFKLFSKRRSSSSSTKRKNRI